MSILGTIHTVVINAIDTSVETRFYKPKQNSARTLMQENTDIIPDVQGYADNRHIAIDRVGIKDIRHPVTVADRSGKVQSTIANFTMTVYLPEDRKGTHMSRFTQLLNEHDHSAHNTSNFADLFAEMNRRLDSHAGTIEMSFKYFIDKAAPVTGVRGMVDYDITLRCTLVKGDAAETWVKVGVPCTTLCPCSKEISAYGAHNQRSLVTIDAKLSNQPNSPLFWEELIEWVEARASCELYSQLKRADEKAVTERAYENPRFVEDLIRDIAIPLNSDARIDAYKLEVENFESIHNHSAYAVIEKDKKA